MVKVRAKAIKAGSFTNFVSVTAKVDVDPDDNKSQSKVTVQVGLASAYLFASPLRMHRCLGLAM